MDEILIDEKRYISSKQAAKITGYAKDYVGQLCREGRIPARLVGRSWYVLESAIQDHRFGSAPVLPEDKKQVITTPISPLSEHLDEPRYSSDTPDAPEEITELPSSEIDEKSEQEDEVVATTLDQTWRSWFEQAQTPVVTPTEEEKPVVEASTSSQDPISVPTEEIQEESEEVSIPVRAIHHALYEPAPGEFSPKVIKHYQTSVDETPASLPVEPIIERKVRLAGPVQLVGIMFASLAVIVAIMGTGYFDSYVVSNRQVSFVAGVSLYNK